ncbi:hypothetical protein PV325_005110 [Microctonus aethiopoides]|nr:hypothetical protein PV325_005110 [Microctonus aethiopoides]
MGRCERLVAKIMTSSMTYSPRPWRLRSPSGTMLSTGVNIIPQTGFSEIFFVDDFGSSTKRKSIKLVDSNDIVKVREILKDGQIVY